MCRGASGVESEEECDRHSHSAHRCHYGQGEASSFAKLAQVEFSSRFEPDDEEEERHQATVDPLAKVERDLCAAEADG